MKLKVYPSVVVPDKFDTSRLKMHLRVSSLYNSLLIYKK